MSSAVADVQLPDGGQVYEDSYYAGLRPDPVISVADWSEKYRILPGKTTAEGGNYRISRTPYVREILEKLSPHDPTREVWWMKGHQIGGTACGENWIGSLMANAGGPSLAVRPSLDKAKEWNRERIQPMIDECPVFEGRVAEQRSREGGNSALYKDFVGGFLRIAGANVPAPLKSSSFKNIYLDEIDDAPQDIGGQGSLVELARARVATYRRSYKMFGTSTPTITGISQIHNEFKRTNQKYWHVPCIRCGEYHPILWRNIKFDKGDPTSARYVCPTCDAEIEEYHKAEMLPAGRWVATAESERPFVEGYHLSALYSPLGWYTWEDAVREFLESKRKGREARKVWTNQTLGETFGDDSDGAEPDLLIARRENYTAQVPEGGMVLTSGVDVQLDRLELIVTAWGIGEESWGVDYRVIHGNPLEREVWGKLDDVLMSQRYRHEHGDLMPISATAVDSGYATQQVYQYVHRRRAMNVFAIKGGKGPHTQMLEPPQRKRRGKNGRPVDLHLLGVDSIKGLLYSRLRLLERGPGFCHFPATEAFDVEFFQQLCAEKRLTRYHKGFPKQEWVNVRPGSRNEALDCFVYAYGALLLLNPVWPALERRRAQVKARLSGSDHEEDREEVNPRPRRRKARGPLSNFVNSYRKGRG